jgi:uncharacterized membrane protein YphA (DoxX/SURF4 family)
VLNKLSKFFALAASLFLPLFSLAHEAYVVPREFFWQAMAAPRSLAAFSVLRDPAELWLTAKIAAGILLLLIINFVLRRAGLTTRLGTFFERWARASSVLVRLAIATAFFLGAQSGVFLGPELPLALLPGAEVLRWALYAVSAMIFFGVYTELAALVALAIFTTAFFGFGTYLATYLNYLGELLALLIFGSRRLSLDRLWRGSLVGWRARWEKYETTLVRVFYGAGLIYAGVWIKLLHPNLGLHVVEEWQLTQFAWLFPADPLLVVLGAGLAEALIGLFILLGFELRMTVIISLFYMTLSLFYFQELVWPHLLLFGISFSLIAQPEVFTLDNLIFKQRDRK